MTALVVVIVAVDPLTIEAEQHGWGVLDTLPGNPLMWVLIISELLIFGAFFVSVSAVRLWHPAEFAVSQSHVDRVAGGINTMILLTSGLAAAQALRSAAEDRLGVCRLWLGASVILGACFLGIKFFEYADQARHGIDIDTDTYFTLFYLMTGFHAAHVVLGIVILILVGWKCSFHNVETGTSFWHMVDLIWMLLYPIVYLIR